MRKSSRREPSTSLMPVRVFSISGKKQISAVMTTVGVMPKPNQMMKSGPSASFGTSWLANT